MIKTARPADVRKCPEGDFLLEEIGMPYTREDYGRQFNNTDRRRNTGRSIPTPRCRPGRRRHGDLGVQHHPALSRRAACARADRRDAGREAAMSSAGWTGCSPRSTRPISRCSGTPRRSRPSARADFAAQAKISVAQLKILDGHLAGKRLVRARQAHHRRHRARADRQALPGIPDRAAGPAGPREMAGTIERGRPLQVATGAKPSARNTAA